MKLDHGVLHRGRRIDEVSTDGADSCLYVHLVL